MAVRQFTIEIAAPHEAVFDLWANAHRAPEWTEGLTRVADITGPLAQVGTRYTTWFGRSRGTAEIVAADRPSSIGWRVRSGPFAAQIEATFARAGTGTRMTETIRTRGLIPWIWGRILSTGSFKGSFRGELVTFARICENELVRPGSK